MKSNFTCCILSKDLDHPISIRVERTTDSNKSGPEITEINTADEEKNQGRTDGQKVEREKKKRAREKDHVFSILQTS